MTADVSADRAAISGNVVALPGSGACFADGRPDPNVVAVLETLLSDAQAGRVIGLAYVTVIARPGDPLGSAFGTGWEGSNGTVIPLGAGILALSARYGSKQA